MLFFHAHIFAGGGKHGFTPPSASSPALQRDSVYGFEGVGAKNVCKGLALVRNYKNTAKSLTPYQCKNVSPLHRQAP